MLVKKYILVNLRIKERGTENSRVFYEHFFFNPPLLISFSTFFLSPALSIHRQHLHQFRHQKRKIYIT